MFSELSSASYTNENKWLTLRYTWTIAQYIAKLISVWGIQIRPKWKSCKITLNTHQHTHLHSNLFESCFNAVLSKHGMFVLNLTDLCTYYCSKGLSFILDFDRRFHCNLYQSSKIQLKLSEYFICFFFL